MRHDPASAAVVIMLRSLKMYGMAQAVTDLIEQGAPAFDAAVPILSQLLKDEMSESEVRELAKSMGVKDLSVTREVLIGAIQGIYRAGGFKSYQLTLVIVNAVMKALIGRGLSFAGNALLTRTMSILAGPIGWAITGVWTAVDIASPAYRVTVPAVIQVAFLRRKYLYADVADQINFS